MKRKHIIILSNNGVSLWFRRVTDVLGSLGALSLVDESMLEDEIEIHEPFDLIIIDASGLRMDLVKRVACLHGWFPEKPVIVLTSSPTWQLARATLLAGAADYMHRAVDNDTLFECCCLLLFGPPYSDKFISLGEE